MNAAIRVAPVLQTIKPATALASQNPPKIRKYMNTPDHIPANVLNFVIFVVTIFGRFERVLRIFY